MAGDTVFEALREFSEERDWGQFHTPANLAKSIAIEAGELLEHYQWDDDADLDEVRDELADVLTYCYFLADRLGLDPEEIILGKLEKTRAKYPVSVSHGRSTKYDRL
jgi:NTP pyrophosphatase (non-canonical NTP hydrolase)